MIPLAVYYSMLVHQVCIACAYQVLLKSHIFAYFVYCYYIDFLIPHGQKILSECHSRFQITSSFRVFIHILHDITDVRVIGISKKIML